MEKKQLVREIKAAALARMEDTARTVSDFENVVKQWDHLDENRERKERYHEISRSEEEMLHWDNSNKDDENGKLKTELDVVIPCPFRHPWWQQLMLGDFIDTIYDNAEDICQLVENFDISNQLKALTNKQKLVVFMSAVRQYTPQQIACYQDKTDRAVRKLFNAAISFIRDNFAEIIREQIEAELPDMTIAKRQFLDWYDKEKITLNNDKSE